MTPQARQILAMLRASPAGITPKDAAWEARCWRLAARVFDLRKLGYEIVTDKSDGYGRYRLIEQLEAGL